VALFRLPKDYLNPEPVIEKLVSQSVSKWLYGGLTSHADDGSNAESSQNVMLYKTSEIAIFWGRGVENDKRENDEPLKLQVKKMQDRKLQDMKLQDF